MTTLNRSPLTLVATLAVLGVACSGSVARASILFSGTPGAMVMTVTEEIRIPLSTPLTESKFVMVLQDAYDTDQGFKATSHSGYGDPGSVEGSVELAGGGVNVGTSFTDTGTYPDNFGIVTPRSFYVGFGLTDQQGAAGDIVVISPGTIVFPSYVGAKVPNIVTDDTLIQLALGWGSFPIGSEPVTIAAASSHLPIPEPTSLAMLGVGALAAVARRRRR